MTESDDRERARQQAEVLARLVESSGVGEQGLRAALLDGDLGELWWERAQAVLYGPEAGTYLPSAALKVRILTACGYDSTKWPDLFSTPNGGFPSVSNRRVQPGGAGPASEEDVLRCVPRYVPHDGLLSYLEAAKSAREFNVLLVRLMEFYGRSYRDLESATQHEKTRLARSTFNERLRSDQLPSRRQLNVFLKALDLASADCPPWMTARDRIACAPLADCAPTPCPKPIPEAEAGPQLADEAGRGGRWTPFRGARRH